VGNTSDAGSLRSWGTPEPIRPQQNGRSTHIDLHWIQLGK
jgi:hypothetical protein